MTRSTDERDQGGGRKEGLTSKKALSDLVPKPTAYMHSHSAAEVFRLLPCVITTTKRDESQEKSGQLPLLLPFVLLSFLHQVDVHPLTP
jgi:hypothetical protein